MPPSSPGVNGPTFSHNCSPNFKGNIVGKSTSIKKTQKGLLTNPSQIENLTARMSKTKSPVVRGFITKKYLSKAKKSILGKA